MSKKLTKILTLIDECNQKDPNIETDINGNEVPKELLYSYRMTEILNELFPNSSEYLKIAARGQHIERWKSLRSDYPEGRTGYKKWRAELGLFHAKRTGECMDLAGYTIEDIERVKYIVQKRGLKIDEETQALEDTICIVFLKYYLNEFVTKHNKEKLIDIIQKTWKKMSKYGHGSALKLNYKPEILTLIQEALH